MSWLGKTPGVPEDKAAMWGVPGEGPGVPGEGPGVPGEGPGVPGEGPVGPLFDIAPTA
jgi:hypothetical protein